MMGSGVTQGGAMQAARASSSPFNYGPMAGGARGFADQMLGYWQRQSARPGQTPWEQQQSHEALAGWQGQVRRMGPAPTTGQAPRQTPQQGQPQGAPQGQATQPVLLRPQQQQQQQARPQAQQQPAAQQQTPNPLLAALQGSPMAQGRTDTTQNALAQALSGYEGGGQQTDFLARLRALLSGGTNG